MDIRGLLLSQALPYPAVMGWSVGIRICLSNFIFFGQPKRFPEIRFQASDTDEPATKTTAVVAVTTMVTMTLMARIMTAMAKLITTMIEIVHCDHHHCHHHHELIMN